MRFLVVGLIAGAVTAGPAGAEPAAGIGWTPCPDVSEVDCGTVPVPVDWSRPDGPRIGIAVARRRATDPTARLGTLVFGPGGPGGSGVAAVKRGTLLSPETHRRFDVLSLDPRGVGASNPVRCPWTGDPVPAEPRTQADFARRVAANRAYTDACRRLTGPVYDFLDTASGVQDLEAIRAAVGEGKLNYYGHSYGTLLGQQYAERYPDRIRTMALDGNWDHSLPTTWRFLRTEATAAQESFEQFVAWCARTTGCALHGQNVRRLVADLRDKADRGQLYAHRQPPAAPTQVTEQNLLFFTNYTSYGPQWDLLARLLVALRDGTTIPIPDFRPPAGPGPDDPPGTWRDPVGAIACQDLSLLVSGAAELAVYRLASSWAAPDIRRSPVAWDVTLRCVGLSDRVRNPQHRLVVRGAPPILMVNSRYDPSTPLEWAGAAARQSGAVLLTYDGWGHGVYWKGSACVVEAADRYLVTGRTPAPGTHCPAVEPAP
ncbi:alpha/beta hydrolase [Actinocrispum wychmicini]|uniref:alpha/beta hydrolase n=1 Tax=Actinocrispum wychmicini TaxID=1213861 RepID=UPI001404C1EB|nr:alpha/beta hydrolase [Actinocrispum wychmicini]